MPAAQRLVITLAMCAGLSPAATISRAIVSTAVDQFSCTAPAAASRVEASKRQVFLWFTAERVRAGDELRVEWVDPEGQVSDRSIYPDLPNASSLCFTTQLPVAGFAPASKPGRWSARVLVNGTVGVTREFQIGGGGPEPGGLRVSEVRVVPAVSGFDLEIAGTGFSSAPTVHLARYATSGGWTYLSAAQPSSATGTSLVSHHDSLPPGEYWAIVQNADRTLSAPMPFVIASSGGYRLPFPAGQAWIITQGPYGSFSHWGNSLHAYDIAPIGGRCVVAMRAGIVHTHDLGMGQDHTRRTFGNYITIDHGDGEYSHYAHLATGTFVVHDGERVEQGQALALVGNSGYTLGEGGGYHVHVHVTHGLSISSGSVPFRFDDLDTGVVRGRVVSMNRSALSDCSGPSYEIASLNNDAVQASTTARDSALPAADPASHGEPAPTERARRDTNDTQFHGNVAVAQWWTDLIVVRKGAKSLDATLAWADTSAGVDLHLMSPSAVHYGWYGNTAGYSGQQSRPQQFHIPHPQPGIWRISVEGTRGGPTPVEFRVDTNAQKYAGGVRAGGGR